MTRLERLLLGNAYLLLLLYDMPYKVIDIGIHVQ